VELFWHNYSSCEWAVVNRFWRSRGQRSRSYVNKCVKHGGDVGCILTEWRLSPTCFTFKLGPAVSEAHSSSSSSSLSCTSDMTKSEWVVSLCADVPLSNYSLTLCHAPLGVHSVIRWHQPPQAACAATPPFDVRSLGLFCGRPGSLQLVTRLPSRTDAFCWQFLSWPENSSFLVLLAYTAH